MNARNAFNPDLEERAEFPKLKAAHGEDPARFLQSSKDLAFARIRGIRDPELLTAYAAVTKQILSGSEKRDVLEAIDERKIELGIGDELAEPTDSRATVTDGGTVTESNPSEPAPEPKGSDDEPDDVHPECKGLEVGQVLELERADGTEFIFPAKPAAEEPFLCRSFDGEGDERTADPIPLTLGEVASRPINDTDPKPVSEIDTRAPKLAASNGGDSE